MSNISVDYDVLNQRGSPAWFTDTFANIPTAGFKGRMFISTDTFAFYRDTGTGWDLIGGPGTGTITGSGVSGQVSYFNGTQVLAGSNNLFWDNTNSRLGINTITPGQALDIHGTANTLVQLNNSTTGNSNIAFQNQDVAKWRIGNVYNGGANSFDIQNAGLSTNALSISSTTNIVSFLNNVSVNSIIIGSAAGSGSNNITISSGMANNTTGTSNTSLGNSALGSNTTGSFNTAIGQGSLQTNSGGSLNTAIGQGSLLTNLNGVNNTAVGQSALTLATGSYNTAIGQGAGSVISTGTNNTLLGYLSGSNITTGSNNTIIGRYAGTSALANNIVLSDGAGNIKYIWDGTANTFENFVKINSVPISTYGLQVNNTLGNPGFVAYQNADSSYALQMTTTGATTISINANASNSYFNTAGNFGFGNNAPTYKLDVSGSIRTTTNIAMTGTSSQLVQTIANSLPGDNSMVLYNSSATGNGLYIGAGGTASNAIYCTDYTRAKNLFLVRGDGEVLVGTTSNTINSSNFGIRLAPDGTIQNSRNAGGGSSVMNVYGNAGQMLVYGNGNIQNTNGSYGTISDLRLKDNIINSTSKLEDLLKVRIVNYNLKKYPNQKLLGVVAQELEEIFPALIETNEQGYKGVKYSIFVPMLIKAIQELNDKLVKNNIN